MFEPFCRGRSKCQCIYRLLGRVEAKGQDSSRLDIDEGSKYIAVPFQIFCIQSITSPEHLLDSAISCIRNLPPSVCSSHTCSWSVTDNARLRRHHSCHIALCYVRSRRVVRHSCHQTSLHAMEESSWTSKRGSSAPAFIPSTARRPRTYCLPLVKPPRPLIYNAHVCDILLCKYRANVPPGPPYIPPTRPT